MPKQFHVVLADPERQQLQRLLGSGQAPARKLLRARILLKADSSPEGPAWSDSLISQALEVSVGTIEYVRKQFTTEGLVATLSRKRPNRIYKKVIDGRAEATLIATACSEPPPGLVRWT